MSLAIEVVKPGALTTVQDLGRPGFAHLGIPRSGAADRSSLKLANRLVGNAEGAAALECTLIGPSLRFSDEALIAITGAEVSARLDGDEVALNSAVGVAAGALLELATTRAGLRSYIAVRGGIEAEPMMGSKSSDLLSGLGPPPLKTGQSITAGEPAGEVPAIGAAPIAPPSEEPVLHLVAGPRADWFAANALELLAAASWEVSSDSNRSGVRLIGPELPRVRDHQLLSEGMAHGAVQVPASGQPIILLADHPTTGGYPVVAVVASADLDAAGQLRPGQSLRFAIS
ncbi:MAG: biotin-dependent carboxyltransferase family protein [Solirubrobacteraceae bacterium]|nr:biotin-dependent carboxyltransferase family protein [Solirubrobacteraceae bacterium]MDP4672854.1 biotin-dependent carboxyltransferase family protein [Solirubrobacteraceae bacterium]MDP4921677.1 biotin-dependent carboxyltransferase family protein [Solirubrobacteraceae bacterium]